MTDTLERREAIARIIEPSAWDHFDRAVRPYAEGRGSQGDENYWYQRTWADGCRTAADVREWWLTKRHDVMLVDIFAVRDSLAKAVTILTTSPRVDEGRETGLVDPDWAADWQNDTPSERPRPAMLTVSDLLRKIRDLPPGPHCCNQAATLAAQALATTPAPREMEADLVEALKPFADRAEYADDMMVDDDDYLEICPMKAGDYRRARATLAKLDRSA